MSEKMPRGWRFHPAFRTSKKVYTSRPPANCRAARTAWDLHAQNGSILWMRLLDGYWGALHVSGDLIDEIENVGMLARAERSLLQESS